MAGIDDDRTATVVRTLRLRRRWRQADLAAAADVPRNAVSMIERGHADALKLATTRRVCAALDVRLDAVPRWRGGDLDRLLNARHAAMAEATAGAFRRLPAWALRPEVSFSIYGERGVIDFVAWHPARQALLLIELKTELVDIGDLLTTTDRRRRLAPRIARDLGWQPAVVGVWVILANTPTNVRRVRDHEHLLRSAFPARHNAIQRWLRDPAGPIAALSVATAGRGSSAPPRSLRRVRHTVAEAARRGRRAREHEPEVEKEPQARRSRSPRA